MSNTARMQEIEKEGIISNITDPSGSIFIKVVSPEDFSLCEFNKLETDYCTIIGSRLYLSSKAKYDHALIHYAKSPQQTKNQ